jgi:hypothetical protein
MSVLKWILDNEATWAASLLVAVLEIGIAYWAKHGLDPEFSPMLHGLVPLLVAPLLRRKVSSTATVERVAEAASRGVPVASLLP